MTENTKSTTKRAASRKSTAKATTIKKQEVVKESPILGEPEKEKPVEVKKPRRISNDFLITVVSNKPNPMHYNCIRTFGEELDWSEYGDTQEMTFEELRAMKGRYPRYFNENWIVIDDSGDYTAKEIYAALGVADKYENSISPDSIMDLLNYSNVKLAEELEKLSDPVKRTVYDIAKQKKEVGQFDSISKFEIIKNIAGMSDVAE